VQKNLLRWVEAARPKTLLAAAGPVVIGWSHANWVHPVRFFTVILTAITLQILSNYSNDLFDFIRGSDRGERLGPKRAVQEGAISPKEMERAIQHLILALSVLGLILYSWTDWSILLLGIVSIVGALLYTATTFSMAYHGWGEFGVFFFFGLVNVMGTEYVISNQIHVSSAFLGCICGCLAAAILLCNNIRDRKQDKLNAKYTLAVQLGLKKSQALYIALVFLPFILILLGVSSGALYKNSLFTLLSLPVSIYLGYYVWTTTSKTGSEIKLNKILENSAQNLAFFCFLYICTRL
jgi:1,4-dihydroxy-2-naphthoate polyprenyltransferase